VESTGNTLKKQAQESVQLSAFEVAEDMGFDGLKIVQDTRLYRFTSDSVLLSKFARVKKGEKVADFCSGSGIVGFHLHALHPEKHLSITLFELQEDLMALSKKTAKLNGFDNFSFVLGKLQDLPKAYHEHFSLITCNPPYERGGLETGEYHKAICRKEITLCLDELALAMSKALRFGGRVCMLHRADRLPEVCYTLKAHNIEVKKIQFVAGRYGAKPYLVLIEGVKGGKPNCEMLPTLINEREKE
jgi:tRNA1(Val) A37 N6-methylase TrmN6